jgi:phytoene synthase
MICALQGRKAWHAEPQQCATTRRERHHVRVSWVSALASDRLSYCARQVERFDNDRFVCVSFAPEAAREDLLALFAFNLEVARIRESVREPMLGYMRLQWWRDAIEQIYLGAAVNHPIADALSQAIRRTPLDQAEFDRLLTGREQDMASAAPEDEAALIAYADQTSGSLLLLALQLLGVALPAARTAARDVGIAWALTGLLRAVPFHARAHRVYLPRELNQQAGLDIWSLFENGRTPGLPRVVEALAGTAQAYLQRARDTKQVPVAATPLLLLATFADHYLARLRRAGFDPFAPGVAQRGRSALLRVALNAALGRF